LEKPSGDEASAAQTKKSPEWVHAPLRDAPKTEEVDVINSGTLGTVGIFVKHFRKTGEKNAKF
jgi:hypothetical protein